MDKAKRKSSIKRTEQEKLDLIDHWEKSGLPIKTFGEQHGFFDSIFHSWFNKYRRGRKSTKQHNGFVPLHIASTASVSEVRRNSSVEIILASGTRIRLY